MRPVARIAQSVEQGIENPRVLGSIPSPGTTFTYMYTSQTPQNSSIITAIHHFLTFRTPLTSTQLSLNQVASGGFSGGSLCSMKIEAPIWH